MGAQAVNSVQTPKLSGQQQNGVKRKQGDSRQKGRSARSVMAPLRRAPTVRSQPPAAAAGGAAKALAQGHVLSLRCLPRCQGPQVLPRSTAGPRRCTLLACRRGLGSKAGALGRAAAAAATVHCRS